MRHFLPILLLPLVLLTSCSMDDIKRIGPLDRRPEWQKTSPYTGESQSRRQGMIEHEIESKKEWKMPAHW